MVIRPGVAGLTKTRLMHLPNLFEGRGEKGQCVNHVMVVMLISYSRVVSVWQGVTAKVCFHLLGGQNGHIC